MEHAASKIRFVIPRSRQERRSAQVAAPPYLTEEGLVLVDRREGRDRRAAHHGEAGAQGTNVADGVSSIERVAAQRERELERMKHLAAFYGYLPAVGGEEVNNPLHPSFSGFTRKLADAA